MCEKNTCVRCGDEYEPYTVLIGDDFDEISSHVKTKRNWKLHEDENDGFCKPCRMVVTDYGAYLTESELEEIEPKHEV